MALPEATVFSRPDAACGSPADFRSGLCHHRGDDIRQGQAFGSDKGGRRNPEDTAGGDQYSPFS
jgi:hypothetical protein